MNIAKSKFWEIFVNFEFQMLIMKGDQLQSISDPHINFFDLRPKGTSNISKFRYWRFFDCFSSIKIDILAKIWCAIWSQIKNFNIFEKIIWWCLSLVNMNSIGPLLQFLKLYFDIWLVENQGLILFSCFLTQNYFNLTQ